MFVYVTRKSGLIATCCAAKLIYFQYETVAQIASIIISIIVGLIIYFFRSEYSQSMDFTSHTPIRDYSDLDGNNGNRIVFLGSIRNSGEEIRMQQFFCFTHFSFLFFFDFFFLSFFRSGLDDLRFIQLFQSTTFKISTRCVTISTLTHRVSSFSSSFWCLRHPRRGLWMVTVYGLAHISCFSLVRHSVALGVLPATPYLWPMFLWLFVPDRNWTLRQSTRKCRMLRVVWHFSLVVPRRFDEFREHCNWEYFFD